MNPRSLLLHANLANQLTLLRLVAVPFFVLSVLQSRFALALAIFLGATLTDALDGLTMLPQKTINVRLANGAKPTEAPSVQAALMQAQAAVSGRGRAFLRPSGTEPVVRVTVEADDDALVKSTLETLAEVGDNSTVSLPAVAA